MPIYHCEKLEHGGTRRLHQVDVTGRIARVAYALACMVCISLVLPSRVLRYEVLLVICIVLYKINASSLSHMTLSRCMHSRTTYFPACRRQTRKPSQPSDTCISSPLSTDHDVSRAPIWPATLCDDLESGQADPRLPRRLGTTPYIRRAFILFYGGGSWTDLIWDCIVCAGKGCIAASVSIQVGGSSQLKVDARSWEQDGCWAREGRGWEVSSLHTTQVRYTMQYSVPRA